MNAEYDDRLHCMVVAVDEVGHEDADHRTWDRWNIKAKLTTLPSRPATMQNRGNFIQIRLRCGPKCFIFLDSNLSCIWTEIFDRLGYDIRSNCVSQRQQTQNRGIFYTDDILLRICSFLKPSKIALLVQVSKEISKIVKVTAFWFPWLLKSYSFSEFCETSFVQNSDFSAYHLFAERAMCRKLVKLGWAELSRFGGMHSKLQAGLTEREITALETAHSCRLPLQLRELYRLCDGEPPEWGSAQAGIFNGYRFLPLAESLALLAEARSAGGDDSVLPLTQVAGFGAAGDSYVVSLRTGQVLKVSGASRILVGDVASFLASIVR